MAGKLRSIDTAIWQDNWFEDLDPESKLLFFYLLTNPQTNMLGIFELSLKRMAFDTGLKSEVVETSLQKFAQDEKVIHEDGFIVLTNFIKHQRYNKNMRIGAGNDFNKLPLSFRTKILRNPSKGFERVRNGLLKKEIEYEYEYEEEGESLSEDGKKEYDLPFKSDKFKNAFAKLLKQPAWKTKTPESIEQTLTDLKKYEEDFALNLVNNGIRGSYKNIIFPDTDEKYQKWKKQNTKKQGVNEMWAEMEKENKSL